MINLEKINIDQNALKLWRYVAYGSVARGIIELNDCTIDIAIEGSLTAVKITKDDTEFQYMRNTHITGYDSNDVVNQAIKSITEEFKEF